MSTLNSLDGRIKANAAVVPAGSSGAISAFVTDTTDLIIDINGYFLPNVGLQFFPVTPCRVFDSRIAGVPLAANSTRTIPVASSPCNVPSNAQAYSLNYTAIPHAPLGYLTTWPTGAQQPLVSTLNSLTGTVTANAAIVPAGSYGSVDVFVTNLTDLAIDIDGYFAPSGAGGLALYNLRPCRILDTRNSGGAFFGDLSIPVTSIGCGVPNNLSAAVMNATVVPPSGLGYLSLWPDGQNRPLVSTLNAFDAAITSNMAIVPTSSGAIDAYASNATQVILDISSFLATPGSEVTTTLSLTDNGDGSGTVSSADAGVSCPPTCSAPYYSTSSVTLNARPNPGSLFAGWSGGGCSGTGTCTIPMNAATTVTATFDASAVSIALSESSAQPGDILRVTGTFDSQAATVINFTDAAGNVTTMNPELVSSTEVDVAVPFYLNVKTVQVGPGTVSVSVVQGIGSSQTTFGPVNGFQIADLPQTGVAAGAVTAEFLKQLQRVVAISSQNWQTIQSVSNGGVNASKLESDLLAAASQLTAAQNMVAQIMGGGAPVPVTTVSGNTVNLDSTALALLDRILLAYVVNAASGFSQVSESSHLRRRGQRQAITSADSVSSIDSWFDGFLGSNDLFEVLAHVKQLRAAANVGVAVGAAALIIAGAPVEVTLAAAGGIGAIIWGATTWVPAATTGVIQGASAEIFNGTVSVSDFQTTAGFLLDSSFDLATQKTVELAGELGGEAGTIAAFLVNTAVDVQSVFSPDESNSVASATENLYQTLVTQFPRPAVLYSGSFSGSVTNQTDCPGVANITGSASVEVSQTSAGVSFSGSATLSQGSGVCNDYSGNYSMSGAVDVFDSSLSVSFGNGTISGILTQQSLTGSWNFQNANDIAGGTFQLVAQ